MTNPEEVLAHLRGEEQLPDSGERKHYDTGAYREADPDKPAMEAFSPYAMERLGKHFSDGAKKYGDMRNWEKGLPYMRYVGAILRHTFAFIRRDESEDHVASIMWNAHCLAHTQDTLPQMDDRPEWPRPSKITNS